MSALAQRCVARVKRCAASGGGLLSEGVQKASPIIQNLESAVHRRGLVAGLRVRWDGGRLGLFHHEREYASGKVALGRWSHCK